MTRRLPSGRDIVTIVEQVITTLTALEVVSVLPPELQPQDDAWVASVELSGAFEGAVALQCPARLARRLTAAMLDLPPDDASDDTIGDALGELVQIIAGNMKSLMALSEWRRCGLSPPVVGKSPREYAAAAHRTRLGFGCGEDRFGLTVWEFETNGRGDPTLVHAEK